AAFLDGRIGFLEIAAIVADTLERYLPAAPESLDAVLAVDAEARAVARTRVEDCVV
ncbi:MAG: 1-deoxy-D-xylulose-5-phosphate reductoisomerase, partial [Sphingomonas sp.]